MTTSTHNPLAGRSTLVVIGAVLIIGFFAASAWWLMRPAYVALFKEANDTSQAQILATLSQRAVPYRINAQEGVIEVPADSAATARMVLAESGVPTREGVGFELFDHADYGMSEFSQKINYQRALEGELARTVMSMSEVQYAKVHLTFKKAALFEGAQEPPKASVIVRLRDETPLQAERVRGIQQLVASAVEGMTQDHVVILSESGQVLSASGTAAGVPEHLQMAAQVEQGIQQKIEQLIRQPLGEKGAQVSVRVRMNFDRVKSVTEQPLAAEGQGLVRHEKRLKSRDTASGDAKSDRSQSSSEVDYEWGKEHAEIDHATGTVEQINVGIVLANSLSKDELSSLRTLVEAAVGLDSKRGDQLVIAFIPTHAPGAIATLSPAPASSIVTKADAAPVTPPAVRSSVDIWRYALAAIIALLALGLALAWWRGRQRRSTMAAQVPRLSSLEREQLLVDLRSWLQREA